MKSLEQHKIKYFDHHTNRAVTFMYSPQNGTTYNYIIYGVCVGGKGDQV